MSKAFTLIELLVVTSIIVLITALILPNYRLGDSQLAIQRSAHKISQDLRRAQEFAISVKEFNGSVPDGYGVYFNLNQPDRYIMFADLDGDKIYSNSNERVEEIIFEGNVTLDSPSTTVFFVPPDPTIYFSPDVPVATINIKVAGASVSAPGYNYNYTGSTYGLLTPRANSSYGVSANCDISNIIADCASSFPATAGEPQTVYDQKSAGTRSAASNIYQKTTTQITVPLQRTIEVNKAGLIFVE